MTEIHLETLRCMEFIQFSTPTFAKDDHDHGRQFQHFPSEPEPRKVGDATGELTVKELDQTASELLISTLLCLDIQLVIHDVILLQLSCGFPKCSRSFEMKQGNFRQFCLVLRTPISNPSFATSPQTSGQSETSHQPRSASKATGVIISPGLVLQREGGICFGSMRNH